MVDRMVLERAPGLRGRESKQAPLAITASPDGWSAAVQAAQEASWPLRLVVHPGAEPYWPDDDAIGALAEANLARIAVAMPVRLAPETARPSLEFIRFLRDSEAYGLRVAWRGYAAAAIDPQLLAHLPAPSRMVIDSGDPAAWTTPAAHRFGRCYWRRGPEFITICDARPGRPAQRLTIAGCEAIRLFMAVQAPARVAAGAADPISRQTLANLIEEGIVLSLGEWALALPCRMRAWPVPQMAI